MAAGTQAGDEMGRGTGGLDGSVEGTMQHNRWVDDGHAAAVVGSQFRGGEGKLRLGSAGEASHCGRHRNVRGYTVVGYGGARPTGEGYIARTAAGITGDVNLVHRSCCHEVVAQAKSRCAGSIGDPGGLHDVRATAAATYDDEILARENLDGGEGVRSACGNGEIIINTAGVHFDK
ncbi:MAG: hypothetical protein R3C68_10005 [Myxococcota bacterium]